MVGLGLGSGGSGAAKVRDRSVYVPLTTGAIYTLTTSSLSGSVTWTKVSGNANLTVSGGAIHATSALTAGASQSIIVRGVSGNDAVEFQVTVTGQISVPSQVGTVTPTAGDTQVALAWSAPANGGSAITDYLVEYKASASGTWLTFSDGVSSSTGATVTGLTNDTSYDFRVSAINIAGTGAASATATATPVSAPVATSTFTITAFASYEANRVFQRDSFTGGGQSMGQGIIPVTINATQTGTVLARCVSTVGGSTVLQAAWAVGTIGSTGSQTLNVTGVDARLGWFELQLLDSTGSWQGIGRLIGMGDMTFMTCTQSLGQYYMSRIVAGTTLLADMSPPLVPDPNSSALINTGSGHYNPTVATAPWQVPADYAYQGGANGAGVTQYLKDEVARQGCNQGFCGIAIGGSDLGTWAPGTPDDIVAQAMAARIGNKWRYEQGMIGHTASSFNCPPEAFTYGLVRLADLWDSRNTMAGGALRVHASIPSESVGSSGTAQSRARIRKGSYAFSQLGRCNYAFMPDLRLLEGIHQHQEGARTHGHHFSAANRGAMGTNPTLGPAVTSMVRTGPTTIEINLEDLGQTLPVLTGNAYKRVFIFPRGQLNVLGGNTNRYPLNNLVVTSATKLTGTLANDPGDGADLDGWIYLPDDSQCTPESDGIYDGVAIAGVLPNGRPIQANSTALAIAKISGSTVNAPPSTATLVSPIVLTGASTTFAAGMSGFGNALTGASAGPASAAQTSSYFYNMTMEGWFKTPAVMPGAFRSFFNWSSHYIGIWTDNKLIVDGNYFSAGALTADTWYHVVYQFGDFGVQVYLNGTRIVNVTTPQTYFYPAVGVNTALGSLAGQCDEWRASTGARYGNSPTITVPSAPFTVDSTTQWLYHFDESNGATTLAEAARL